ncbi:MAG: ABC transporter ATP-binding protein [Bacteroidetes bacterium]|nr:MAG: ABC transporter ATP-binding protein [Bacteroidota bacterium]
MEKLAFLKLEQWRANVLGRLHHLRRAVSIIWQAAGAWSVGWLVLLILSGLIPAAIVYITKWLVDNVAVSVGAGLSVEEVVWQVGIPAAVMGGLMLAQRALASLSEWVSAVQSELVQEYVKEQVLIKAGTVDYEFYESDEYFDLLNRANSQASTSTLALLRNAGGLLRSLVTLVSIGAMLMLYGWWLPFVLIFSAIPAFFVLVRHNRRQHDWWKRVTQDRRWLQYYDTMLTQQYTAAEIRLNDIGGYFLDLYLRLRRRLRGEQIELVRDRAVAKFLAALFVMVVTALVMAWMVWRAVQGTATLGDLALFYQAFNQGQSLVTSLMSGVGEIYTNTLFVQYLFEFLDQPQKLQDPPKPQPFPRRLQHGITFENVSFRYPGTDTYVLKDFTMHIPAGKVVAVVGENGAGKSTFTKLLCRFYDPQDGRVLIDGTDLRAFAQKDVQRSVSLMVQFPVKFQLPVALNIQLGDMERANDRERLLKAARIAGAHEFIQGLPQQYDTLLGRWFSNGIELSGGQWQRIALARAFFRDAPVVVLDEPTSFMDSWGEYEWIRRFKQVVQNQTALFITHRFTTAKQADLIIVMKDGQVVEQGTHAELLTRQGHYATSWYQQMESHPPGSPPTGDGAPRPTPCTD